MCSKGRKWHQLSRWVAASSPGSGCCLSVGPTSPSTRVPKSVGVRLLHVYAVLALTQEHHPLYGHFCGVRSPGLSWPLLEHGLHLFFKPGNVTALLVLDFMIGHNAKYALADDRARVCPCHLDVGAMIFGVDTGHVAGIYFVPAVCLEMLQIHLVAGLSHNVYVLFHPLTGMRYLCLRGRRPLLLWACTLGVQIFNRRV